MNIIPNTVTPKNVKRSGHFITFFNINASGSERVTVAVINARAEPSGTPFSTNASITGTTLTELAYRGIPRSVAIGYHIPTPDG